MSTETQETIETLARGRGADGCMIATDRRLFMQFLAFGNCEQTAALTQALEAERFQGALYEDVNDARGVGLIAISEDPDYFVTAVRRFLNLPPFSALTPKP